MPIVNGKIFSGRPLEGDKRGSNADVLLCPAFGEVGRCSAKNVEGTASGIPARSGQAKARPSFRMGALLYEGIVQGA
jgi:hypothetical protein